MSAQIDAARWESAFLAEIDRVAALTPGRVLRSVFFGGGTPSLMEPDTVAALIERIRRNWQSVNDLEITLEANPTSVESARFRAFREAGVNRISMGIQALNDIDLKRLGRMHSSDEALRAFDIARKQFDRVSFDLIYGRQGQTLDGWRRELDRALERAVDHLSLYQLTIEPNTVFSARFARGKLPGLPDEALSADFYDVTQEVCERHGMPSYEVSNHARENAESRHNLIYWRYGDYAGIGPGAHGRLILDGNRWATEAFRMPEQWLSGVDAGSSEKSPIALTRTEQATEMLIMGLRLSEGISVSRYERVAGRSFDPDAVNHLMEIGMIEVVEDRLMATRDGRLVLNSIIEALMPE